MEKRFKKRELEDILGSKDQIKVMENVFKEHTNIPTVVVEPDSWLGREVLWQSRKLIELESHLNRISSSIVDINSMDITTSSCYTPKNEEQLKSIAEKINKSLQNSRQQFGR